MKTQREKKLEIALLKEKIERISGKKVLFKEENSESKFEITDTANMDKESATKTIEKFYPNNLLYKGHEFFDKVYMDKITDFARQELRIGEMIEVENEEYDEEEDEWYTDTSMEEIDGQESYLGYLPKDDIFISGWDMFGEESDNNLVYLRLDENLNPRKIEGKFYGYGLFYQDSGYKRLHKIYPNLIDIRLD